ncbi:uncharacterized protein H6S33_000014 [Morchella sextelata]|uniref:uncharacterized protein n=1 Tax=Morchella sextelata TaxID=1174677 RepID=UPI001D047AC7|nr:uncharacterized protein H6S33_000014 [Morchella sextelata]KAH0614378.1 hypothetical protein H6S33_000014 [Morchella sextelata]
MPPSVYNSTSVLSNDSHSSDQISSRDLEDLVISRVNTPSYPTNQSMEQEDEEFVPETSEWNELLDALQVERRRVTMFHSMSPIERFLSGERVEDCSVELRVWGAEEHPKQ